jgi:4-amino-4-deoxy-L-arabinose transferase-like glycosyltransferase
MSRINATSAKYATLFFGCLIFHVVGTWSLPLIDRDEPRFAEASREMIERGDYVVPYFNNRLRLDKPPLAYWGQVATYRIFGENDFSARFPSAIAAALTALVIFAWGRRLGGTGVGWWAAIIFTLSLQTFLHAKAAVADMWLVLFVTLAHRAGYELLGFCQPGENIGGSFDSRTRRFNPSTVPSSLVWWWIFYISLALGFLAKGPIAWIPLVTVAATIMLARNGQLAGPFKFTIGIPLMLAAVALWGIPALIQTRGEFFTIGIGRHVISRSLKTMEGHGAGSFVMYLLLLPFYFVTVFVSFFPWSIKLPWLAKKLWRSRDNVDNYFLTGVAIIFIIFTLISTKLPHYTLPAFGLLALLLARHWLETTTKDRRSFSRIAAATACAWLAIALVVPPMAAQFFPAYQLLQLSRGSLQPNMQFASTEFEEPSLVWYFRSRVQGFFTPLKRRRAAEFMSLPGPRFIILPTAVAESVFANPPPDWKFFATNGVNIAKGKRADLTLVLKSE